MRLLPWITGGVLLVCGGITWLGNPDREVAFSTAGELWADVLRDADQFGLQLSRVPATEEKALGRKLAAALLANSQTVPAWEGYVNEVGQAAAKHVRRREIAYEFHVIQGGERNAFAMPGGQIFVTEPLLDCLESEAELAAILGHEIAHVDAFHTIERYQYQMRFRQAGLGVAGEALGLARLVVAAGYAQYQELEADSAGLEYAVKAGYDPSGAVEAFRHVLPQTHPQRPPATPLGEMTTAMGAILGGYFQTHPPTPERMRRLETEVKRHARKGLYRGRENYRTRVPKQKHTFPEK